MYSHHHKKLVHSGSFNKMLNNNYDDNVTVTAIHLKLVIIDRLNKNLC